MSKIVTPYKREGSKGRWFLSCEICGFKLFVEKHHVQRKPYRGINGHLTIAVCPNHHAIFDFLANQVIISGLERSRFLQDEEKINDIRLGDPKAFAFFEKWIEPILFQEIDQSSMKVSDLIYHLRKRDQ